MHPVALPEGLAAMPPGPALGAALAELDPCRVANGDTVTVLAAQYRQLAHEQARLLEAMVEVGRSDPEDLDGARRLPVVGEWASGEIAAALTLTGVAADRELRFADTMVTRLPLVHAALVAGAIDRAKAWVFADHLDDLTSEQIAVICAALVPVAPGLTTGQLRARLARMIYDIDPQHARRRYQRAVRERAVVGYLQPDGTVTVTANGLPTDEAAVACERLDVLAAAVQRAGHPGRLGQIQADLFLGMLDGAFHHLSEPEIIAAMLRRVRPEDAEPSDAPAPSVAEDASGAAADADARGGTAGAEATASTGTQSSSPAAVDVDHPAPGRKTAAPRVELRTGVEIRAGLTTLIGLDDLCGEVPGLGPVLPGVARALAAAQYHGAEWRFAVTDAEGFLLLAGTTRRRPTVPALGRGMCRSGVVELHTSADVLTRLAADPDECGPWAAVVADIAGQYADRERRLARLDQRPTDRFARVALARHVEIRDRTCCFPGCRRPARKSDKDHTVDHAGGGATARCNIGPLCDRRHRYKSEGWWVLAQPEPGRFHWTSPLRRSYRSRGEPISPPTTRPCPRPSRLGTDLGSPLCDAVRSSADPRRDRLLHPARRHRILMTRRPSDVEIRRRETAVSMPASTRASFVWRAISRQT